MGYETLEEQLGRLVTGLADQEISKGCEFRYDGGKLHADDVPELALPSILCISQDLAERLGQGGFGYRFDIRKTPNPVFPLYATGEGAPPDFFRVSPFVLEVFQGEVLDCRADLALLFESAARLLRPGFSLAANTAYSAGPTGVDRPALLRPAPTLGR